ncbi:MAG: hypothetical protein NXI10_02920 [bacterium]|nr:hypothetical protein [bacterium]
MKNETVYDILLDYLEQRKSFNLDSKSIERRLSKIGKNEDQIHEIMVEFDDEWDREQLFQHELKKANFNLYGGGFLAVAFAVLSILSALNVITFGGVNFVFYGAVAFSTASAIWGWNTLRKSDLRDKRLRIKYEKW